MGKYSLPKKEPVVSEENAHAQVMLIVERYNVNTDNMEESTAQATEQALDHVLDSIMSGWFQIENVDNEIIVTQFIENKSAGSNVEKLVYGEMRFKHHQKMSEKAEGNKIRQAANLLRSMCKTPNGHLIIDKLRASDANRAEFLSLLFL